MENKRKTFNSNSFLLFNSESLSNNEHLSHFALTDALIDYSGKNNQPIIHFWQTSPLIILGMMDTKIGHFEKAIKVFDNYKYNYMLRNSGGLAVVSDPGTLNVSLIYPSKELSIDQSYQFMLDFIRQTFYPYFPKKVIEAFEIKNSYCFGDYDLSINGQKIAGISQRRIKQGVAIMLYISINGDQDKRSKIIKKFYESGLDGSEPEGRYPNIKINRMTSLEKAYQTKLEVSRIKKMMLRHFSWSKGEYTKEIMTSFDQSLKKMYQRNIRFLDKDYVKKNLK